MKICPSCQGENHDESRFCSICGHSFVDESNPAETNPHKRSLWLILGVIAVIITAVSFLVLPKAKNISYANEINSAISSFLTNATVDDYYDVVELVDEYNKLSDEIKALVESNEELFSLKDRLAREKALLACDALKTDVSSDYESELALYNQFVEFSPYLEEKEKNDAMVWWATRNAIFDVENYLKEEVLYNPKSYYRYSINASADEYNKAGCDVYVTVDFSSQNNLGIEKRHKDIEIRASYYIDFETLELRLKIVDIEDIWFRYDYLANGLI